MAAVSTAAAMPSKPRQRLVQWLLLAAALAAAATLTQWPTPTQATRSNDQHHSMTSRTSPQHDDLHGTHVHPAPTQHSSNHPAAAAPAQQHSSSNYPAVTPSTSTAARNSIATLLHRHLSKVQRQPPNPQQYSRQQYPPQHPAGDGPPYSWKACQGELPFTTASVTLTPDRPHHGRTMKFQISGTSTGAVTGGHLHVIVYYSGWHVWSETQELCKAVACPVQPGQAVTISNAHKLPVVAPPGAYRLRFSGSNQDNAQWVCVDVSFHVSAASQAAAGAAGAGAAAAIGAAAAAGGVGASEQAT